MIESGRPSLLDLVAFDDDINILESFTYPVGAVCLLERQGKTCVYNIDSFYGYLNSVCSEFQNPKDTIPIYSRFFLERLRNGNFEKIDFNSIPQVRTCTPDFVHFKDENSLPDITIYQNQEVA